MFKKSQGITLNTIIIAVLGILVLVTLALIFGGKLINFGSKTTEIENSVGDVDQVKCKLKCSQFNTFCIDSYVKDSITYYYGKDSNLCKGLADYLEKCNENGFVTFNRNNYENHKANNDENARGGDNGGGIGVDDINLLKCQ